MAAETTVQGKVDPTRVDNSYSIFKLMSEKTFKIYKRSWMEFVTFAGVHVDREPLESDFQGFFDRKRDAGLCGNSIRCIYSHLNKVYKVIYGKNLGVSEIHFTSANIWIIVILNLGMATAFRSGWGLCARWKGEKESSFYQRRTRWIFEET